MIAGVEGLHDWREYLHRHPVEPESILRFLSESPHLAKQPTLIGNHEYLLGWDGLGNWLEPEDGVLTLGPGAQEVKVAACSLVYHSSLSATEIARESIRIASRHSVWINDRVQVEGIATPDVGF
jgi:ATP-dependent protease HslVU (ClpYQ) peptidase subunit